MRVGAVRVGGDRQPVRVDGLRAPPQVLQGDAEVERGGAVLGPDLEGAPVVLRRAGRLARLVQQPSAALAASPASCSSRPRLTCAPP